MKKKKVAVILSLGVAALLMIGGISVYAHQFSDSAESETVYKETTAGYGTLTVGITESGSVTIGSISQDMDEDISISSDSGSGQTSGCLSGCGMRRACGSRGSGESRVCKGPDPGDPYRCAAAF